MCIRINNLHNLNMALEDIQLKIATVLGVYRKESEESANVNEHIKDKRNGIYFK